MKHIPLKGDKVAVVDDDDYEFVNGFRWYLNKGYAQSYAKGRLYKMHRLVMVVKRGQHIDHINHDKLDNRKENLRLCSRAQNNRNLLRRKDNTSGYKNVYRDLSTGHWRPYIYVDGKPIYFGSFKEKRHAAIAHAIFVEHFHGEFATSNFTATEIVSKSSNE